MRLQRNTRYYPAVRPAIPRREVGCSRVTHPFATNIGEQALLRSSDLHVLGTPPAFVLSQDQTLHVLKRAWRHTSHPEGRPQPLSTHRNAWCPALSAGLRSESHFVSSFIAREVAPVLRGPHVTHAFLSKSTRPNAARPRLARDRNSNQLSRTCQARFDLRLRCPTRIAGRGRWRSRQLGPCDRIRPAQLLSRGGAENSPGTGCTSRSNSEYAISIADR